MLDLRVPESALLIRLQSQSREGQGGPGLASEGFGLWELSLQRFLSFCFQEALPLAAGPACLCGLRADPGGGAALRLEDGRLLQHSAARGDAPQHLGNYSPPLQCDPAVQVSSGPERDMDLRFVGE